MKGYKTLVVNGAAAALPVLDMVVNNGDLVAAAIGPQAVAALSVLGLVNMVLRWITTTPVMKGE